MSSKKTSLIMFGRGLLLLIIPLMMIMWIQHARNVKGPFFMQNDPEYIYLMNSLLVMDGVAPFHVDHPGTPLQTLGAVVIVAVNPGVDRAGIVRAVISNPEAHLSALGMVLSSLSWLIVLAVGVFGFLLLGSIFLALMIQLSFVLSPTLLLQAVRIYPEPLLIFVTGLLVIISLSVLKYGLTGNLYKFALLFGVATGFAMSAKITSLSLLLIPFAVLPGVRARLLYLVSFLSSLVAFTLPILGKYEDIWIWIKGLFLHTGRYGHGSEGVVEPGVFLQSVLGVAVSENLLIIICALTACYLIAELIRDRGGFVKTHHTRLVSGMFLAQVIQIVMFAKHPGSNRYLVPSLALSGCVLAVILHHLVYVRAVLKPKASWIVLVVLVIISSANWCMFDVREWYREDCESSNIYGSLKRGSWWSRDRYIGVIEELYDDQQ